MCLDQQVLMVPHQSLGLNSFSARVLELVRLTLLKRTCCSNLADSLCRKPRLFLGFLKIITPIFLFLIEAHYPQQVALQTELAASHLHPGQGKSISEGFITPGPYQWKAGAREASIIQEGSSTWQTCSSVTASLTTLLSKIWLLKLFINTLNIFRVFQPHKSRKCICVCPYAHLWVVI